MMMKLMLLRRLLVRLLLLLLGHRRRFGQRFPSVAEPNADGASGQTRLAHQSPHLLDGGRLRNRVEKSFENFPFFVRV